MITQTDSYPYGYQQQTYAVSQQGGYPPCGYNTSVPGMQMASTITTRPPSDHYVMGGGGYADHYNHGYNTSQGGYAHSQEGWGGNNKPHNYGSGRPDHFSQGYNSQGGATNGGYGTYPEGHRPGMQAVGYAYGTTYEGHRPGKGYPTVQYWGFKEG